MKGICLCCLYEEKPKGCGWKSCRKYNNYCKCVARNCPGGEYGKRLTPEEAAAVLEGGEGK